MRIRDISSDRWERFFDDFTHLHAGKHVNVESMKVGDAGAKRCMHDQPLAGVAIGRHEEGKHQWIEVVAGIQPGEHVAHYVERPERVVVAEEENGESIAVQIESNSGEITIVRFEPARENLPEGFIIN